MQIFISEFLTSGAWTGQVSDSLAEEGRAMLLAFAEDAARIRDVKISTTWDSRLGPFPLHEVDVRLTKSPDEEALAFRELADLSDAVFVIAPETDNLLLKRYDLLHALNRQWIGASRETTAVCTDKLITARILTESGVPTIPTRLLAELPDEWVCPLVVKPRDGAGSDETFVVNSRSELTSLPRTRSPENYIVQPFIDGIANSCFCVVRDGHRHLFPMAGQHINIRRRMKYLGGQMPLDDFCHPLVSDCLNAIGARTGHFGIDIVVPADGSPPLVVEVNPRLTTSYLGYRQIMTDNVAERILFPERFSPAVNCNGRFVRFDSHGNTGRLADEMNETRR